LREREEVPRAAQYCSEIGEIQRSYVLAAIVVESINQDAKGFSNNAYCARFLSSHIGVSAAIKGFLPYHSVRILANSNPLGCKVHARIVVGKETLRAFTEEEYKKIISAIG
jgi:hypothetical protein